MTPTGHQLFIEDTAFGWGWYCVCGAKTRGSGAFKSQTAAYSGGERHIRTALKKARS